MSEGNETLSAMSGGMATSRGAEAIEMIDGAADILREAGLMSGSISRKFISVKHSVQGRIGVPLDPPKAREEKPYRRGYVALLYLKDDPFKLPIQVVSTTQELADFAKISKKKACEILRHAKKTKYCFRIGKAACRIEYVNVGAFHRPNTRNRESPTELSANKFGIIRHQSKRF